MALMWPWAQNKLVYPIKRAKIVWIDLGDLGDLVHPEGPHEQWQDHGLGLLRTILHRNGILTDVVSTRAVTSWDQLAKQLVGYDMALMNVRSYTYPSGRKAAQVFKQVNPNGSGARRRHACDGRVGRDARGPRVRQDLPGRRREGHRRPGEGPGRVPAAVYRPERPQHGRMAHDGSHAVAEAGKPPACPPFQLAARARVRLGSRARRNHPDQPRLPVAVRLLQRELLRARTWAASRSTRSSTSSTTSTITGALGSFVIHDSMFFQNPSWLKEWIEKYPRKANQRWTYWAAARADTVRQWPDLFEALIKETNWNLISIGFESGSDRILRLLNKECTEEDNNFAIDLLNRLGDELRGARQAAAEVLVEHHAGHPRRAARGRVQDDAHDQAHEARLPVDLVLRAVPRLSARLPAHRRRQEPACRRTTTTASPTTRR